MFKRICKYENCNKEFLAERRRRQFCCRSCFISWKNKNIKVKRNSFTNEHKEKIGKANTKAWKIRRKNGTSKMSEEVKNKIRQKMIGKKSSNDGSLEFRIKIQNGLINALKNRKTFKIGKNETKLLNEQEIKDNCKIERQYPIKFDDHFYAVDGYCKETNTVYEVYEKSHFRKCQLEHDLKRQKEIQDKLNCKFVIIKDEL